MTKTTFQWLQKAFLRYVQDSNGCDEDDVRACNPNHCGCQDEMEKWIDETPH